MMFCTFFGAVTGSHTWWSSKFLCSACVARVHSPESGHVIASRYEVGVYNFSRKRPLELC